MCKDQIVEGRDKETTFHPMSLFNLSKIPSTILILSFPYSYNPSTATLQPFRTPIYVKLFHCFLLGSMLKAFLKLTKSHHISLL